MPTNNCQETKMPTNNCQETKSMMTLKIITLPIKKKKKKSNQNTPYDIII